MLEWLGGGLSRVGRAAAGVTAACVFAVAAPVAAQVSARLPFEAGEVLAYRVRIPLFGTVGRATFRVDGPVVFRGEQVLLLRSDVVTKFGPIRGNSESMSWFDPARLLSMRFEKDERQPGYRDEEAVSIFPASRTFVPDSGESRDMPTSVPLDELSFIYFLRTLELLPDSVVRLTRHYDPLRNPVSIRVVRRETIETGIGKDDAWLIEMRVRHPRHYRGEGVIRIHLSADARRIPLRIESHAPATGKVTLVLDRYTTAEGPAVEVAR